MQELFTLDDHIYSQLANRLRDQIKQGDLKGKIPSIRELADQYSVNFKTANKAVDLLVNEGYLFRLRGKGTFVADEAPAYTDYAVIHLLITDIINPYFAQLAQALEEASGEFNSTVNVNTNRGSATLLQGILESYKHRQRPHLMIVQGGVVRDKSNFEMIARYGIPMVGNHTHIPDIDDVWLDVRAGAQLATDHLVQRFGTDVGFISGSSQPVQDTGRFKGYRDSLLSYGGTINQSVVLETEPTYRGGYQAVLGMIERKQMTRSLLFYNQIMAMGGISALLANQLTVPQDVAVACIDDSIDTSQMLVATTSILFPANETARQLLYLSRRRLATPDAAPASIRVAPRLILRDSSGG